MTAPLTAARIPYRVLFTLAFGVFALCSSEYVVVGVLVDIAQQLAIPLSRTGGLLTAYALTAAGAGPVVALATTGVRLKLLIVTLIVVFAAANLVIGVTSSFAVLVVARSVSALAHSTFAAACIIVGVRCAPPVRAGAAIAWVTAGFSAATVLGGPIGAFLSAVAGWHAAFLAVAVANVLAGCAIAVLVPDTSGGETTSVRVQLRRVLNSEVLAGLMVTAVAQAAWFAPYGYVVAALTGTGGLSRVAATLTLLAFGVGNVGGNLVGGRLVDRAPRRSLVGLLAGLAVALGLYSVFAHLGGVLVAVVVLIGVLAGAVIPAFNTWVLTAAGGDSVLSLTLVTSAFNLGNGIGAAGAGALVAAGAITSLGYAGAMGATAALVMTWRWQR